MLWKFFQRLVASILFVALILASHPAHASGRRISGAVWEGMTRRIWRMQDGLSDNVISAVAETPEHYLWLGTPRNLMRFDGFHFTDVSTEMVPAIHDFGVTCLFTATDGSLWIGTGDGTLLRSKGTLLQTYSAKNGLPGYDVRVLQQDSAGKLWAGTDHGVYRFVDGNFQRIPRIGDPSVHAMISDGAGGLWMGGHHLIHYVSGIFQNVALPKQKVPTRIEALARTPDGTLWIGTSGGLLYLDGGGGVSSEKGISQEVKALLVDQNRRLWVGTLDGGLFLQQASNTFTHVDDATAGLSNTVLSLLNDQSGDLWLGTPSGLVRLSNTGMHLIAVPAIRNAQRASVTVDSDGSLWICAGKVFHLAKGAVQSAQLPLVGDFPVRTMMRDAGGSLWIGTSGGGAIRVLPNGSAKRYAIKVGTSYVTGFLQGAKDDVWIATESGIALWHKGDVVSFQHLAGAPHQPVLSMARAAPEGIWIGTSHGLFLFRDDRFVPDPAIPALGSHPIRALYSSADGTLWIGTESGLFRWKNRQMREVPFADGRSQAVESILEDPLGRLWLGGPDRVRRVQLVAIDRVLDSTSEGGEALPARAMGSTDVLDPEDFNVAAETGAELYGGMQSSSALDEHNGAWYISDAGPVHISGDTNELSKAAPPVVLQQIVVDGRQWAISPNSTLSLPPSAKTLDIEATPVVLGSHAGLQIRRKLIGFDKSWHPLPASRVATYTNLPPGNYIYQVEASWRNGRTSSSVALHIIQEAHFYREWWFLAICTFLSLISAWLLHRLKVHRLAAQFHAVAEERNRVAREMHDTILQGCIGISFLLDGIASSQQRQEMENKSQLRLADRSLAALNLARTEIEKTIHEARVAIWNLRRTEPQSQLDRSLRELFDKMTGTLATPASFQSSGPSLQITQERQREILMTVREALQNAIKHAGDTKISLCLRYMTNLVQIEITDRGPGISAVSNVSKETDHFGVIGMRERMAKVGGTCCISSTKGGGTTVTLQVPVEATQQTGMETK